MTVLGKVSSKKFKVSRLSVLSLKLPTSNGEEDNVEKLVDEMFCKEMDKYFRGWILPNGQTISQYRDDSGNRQDHSKIIKLFIKGLKEYDVYNYMGIMNIYQKYVANNYNGNDIFESFAVEYLGWIQVSENGQRRVICRGERWQDKYIGPFINQNNFSLIISDNGHCHDHLFPNLYDNSKEIISIALGKQISSNKENTR